MENDFSHILRVSSGMDLENLCIIEDLKEGNFMIIPTVSCPHLK
jgi:hypothetical protein